MGTYVSLSILNNGLPVLGSVMTVVSVRGDSAKEGEEGDSGEDLHGEDDGLRREPVGHDGGPRRPCRDPG